MRDEPGWITDKAFDCMRADCVPVYWGSANVEAYLASADYVEVRDNVEFLRSQYERVASK